MSGFVRKTITAGMAALTLGAGVMVATPSQAQHVWIRGAHGGGHGGVYRGHGVHGGHGGYGGYRGYGGYGVPFFPFPIYGAQPPFYGYDGPCWQYRRVYDYLGRYLGRHLVDVCN